MNLAYSILVNYGKFTGAMIENWAKDESDRIAAALAEKYDFDQEQFRKDVDHLIKECRGRVATINRFIVPWAVCAACAIFITLIFAGFNPGKPVTLGLSTITIGLILSGAVPSGLVGIGIVHLYARYNMGTLSSGFNGFLRYIRKTPKEELQRAKKALSDKVEGATDRSGAS